MRPVRPNTTEAPRPSRDTPKIAHLEGQVERLLLVTEALWTILKEQHGFDEQDLLRRIVQIDLKDGRLDGRVAASPPEACPKCQRPVSRKSVRCMFCGEPMLFDPFAR
jgi:hypothetical protein